MALPLPWGGENQVIFAQKLIPFLFRIEKKLSKNSHLNNLFSLTIHNSQFTIINIQPLRGWRVGGIFSTGCTCGYSHSTLTGLAL
ncbi:MAG: hypothetical protein DRR08_33605 [Candidatus Parabeggiatoa sp. nov. 2]|nr:MAG: hypothetical protein DRR08_33605 [Gammaproteobacteria bacterium]